ncbi:MAG: HNH endonuclease signature motif containing protein [Candidatus Binatia bacterium]
MGKLEDDNRDIQIGQKLAAHFSTLTDSELIAASGLGLRQPHQYETQRATAHAWKPFSVQIINKQWVSYANVPLLIKAELVRRAGKTPTVSRVVRDVIDAGFAPKTAWPRGLEVELVGYVHSAKQRGLCQLTDGRPFSSLALAADSLPPVDVEAQDLSDDELEKVILENRGCFPGEIETSSSIAEVRRRHGQAKLRELTLRNYAYTCALCEISDTQLLVTSHVIGWSERTETRGLLSNVLCLCRFHDALFESGYWSLSDDLRVVQRSPIDSATIRDLLPTTCSFRQPASHPPAPQYIRHHRMRHGL